MSGSVPATGALLTFVVAVVVSARPPWRLGLGDADREPCACSVLPWCALSTAFLSRLKGRLCWERGGESTAPLGPCNCPCANGGSCGEERGPSTPLTEVARRVCGEDALAFATLPEGWDGKGCGCDAGCEDDEAEPCDKTEATERCGDLQMHHNHQQTAVRNPTSGHAIISTSMRTTTRTVSTTIHESIVCG